MRLSKALLLIAAASVSTPSAAEMLEYQFTGTITSTHPATTILLGDTFAGSWNIEISQPGEPISAPGFNGRHYELASLQIDLNGETAVTQGGVVFVSESAVDPAFLELWPSGFSSGYIASIGSSGLQRWSVDVQLMQFGFSYDGLGKWNNLDLPGDFDFLHNVVENAVLIRISDAGVIIGRIESVVARAVPLVSPVNLLVSALSMLAIRVKVRRNCARTST